MKKNNRILLIWVVLVGLFFLMIGTAPAEEVLTATNSAQEVGVLHRLSNRVLPLKTVWDIVNNNVPNSVRDFWGARGKMEEKGITFSFVYTGDMAFNTAGGTKRGSSYFSNLDMSITLDSEKLGLWKGGTLFAYALSDSGGRRLTGELVGDVQGVSNIDAPHMTKIFELWYEQKLFEDRLAVLMGMHDINADFDTNEYGRDLLNGSFGIQPTLTANTSASVFPSAGPAIRFKIEPNKQWTFLVGVFDGNQGDAEKGNRHGIHNSVNDKGGLLEIAEVDYHSSTPVPFSSVKLPGTIRLGMWYHTARFDDISDLDSGSGDPISHSGNYGLYMTADQMIYKENESEDDDQGLGVFVQMSSAPQDRNTITMYRGFGMQYKGLIPRRDKDALSIGIGQAYFSDALQLSEGKDDYERVFEATYRIQLTDAVVFQPDIQFVKNPNGDPALKDATVVLLRTQISF